jgi:hypothetical protein
MDNFGLVDVLEAYALGQGWKFVLKFDEFYANLEVQDEYINGQLVLTADVKSNPTIVNGQVTTITYTALLALGRKFDDDGEVASLDESYKQKYDRRLKDLESALASTIGTVACSNELDVTNTDFISDINVYDTNIDFIITTATFIQ